MTRQVGTAWLAAKSSCLPTPTPPRAPPSQVAVMTPLKWEFGGTSFYNDFALICWLHWQVPKSAGQIFTTVGKECPGRNHRARHCLGQLSIFIQIFVTIIAIVLWNPFPHLNSINCTVHCSIDISHSTLELSINCNPLWTSPGASFCIFHSWSNHTVGCLWVVGGMFKLLDKSVRAIIKLEDRTRVSR